MVQDYLEAQDYDISDSTRNVVDFAISVSYRRIREVTREEKVFYVMSGNWRYFYTPDRLLLTDIKIHEISWETGAYCVKY
jgi:hypothetical protein